MWAAPICGACDIRMEEISGPRIELPTDAVVRATQACICGSDLWAYQGMAKRNPRQRIGHEFVGVVEDVDGEVKNVKRGDTVVARFMWSDGTCESSREGLYLSCVDGRFWGEQGEAVQAPHADGTLVKVPDGWTKTRLRRS